MRKERLLQLMFIVSSILFVLLSFLINTWFGEIYMFLLFLVTFCVSILLFSELYLRIQWNIDKKSQITIKLKNEIKELINGKFQENKEILGEIVDFFENLLKYIENEKDEKISNMTELKEILNNELIKNINERFENISNQSNKSFKESSEFQEKLTVIMRQILEYQKDQTNFLNKEIKKLKNESKTQKK